VVSPYPTGTCTRQEAPSFAWRTNNLAERILRHWVIHRRITYGTRTEAGTRALGIIASVIDTCRLRHINPWPFLADALRARRNGAQSLTMPLAAA